jgi:hypothetical protein
MGFAAPRVVEARDLKVKSAAERGVSEEGG